MDIICFANDWAGDRLSKKQIMLRLARRHRILWINSLNNRRPRVAQKDFRRVLVKLRDFSHGLQQVHKNIWVLAPIYFPFHSQRWLRDLNRYLLRMQILMMSRRLGFKLPISYTFIPTSAHVVGSLGEKLIVYHCVDEYAAFSDAAPEVGVLERELLAKADLVFVCSTPLLERKLEYNRHTSLVTHGVDYEHFRKATDESTPVAPELSTLPRPVLGFHGWVADWVDLRLIAELARLRPQWSIVLVGRADGNLSAIQGMQNVYALGQRSYERLPEYLRGFDVALLPFVMNELTRHSSPLKLREYLAAGLPIVATALPEVVKFNGLVSLASTAEEYICRIDSLLERGIHGPSRERAERVSAESWDYKVKEIEHRICNSFAGKSLLGVG